MKTDSNGCSTCKKGEESFEEFEVVLKRKIIKKIQYDYRAHNGKLFSCVSSNLEKCREKKDKWLLKI